MDIHKMINEIIPPADYQHRNGFNNTHLIDNLNDNEKRRVELNFCMKRILLSLKLIFNNKKLFKHMKQVYATLFFAFSFLLGSAQNNKFEF